jgi:hypothetical protein
MGHYNVEDAIAKGEASPISVNKEVLQSTKALVNNIKANTFASFGLP